MVIGFEPRDEAGCAGFGFGQLAESHEGAHLVDVAAHGLGEHRQAVDERIGGIVEQRLIVHDAHQRGIQQREPLGIGVAHDRLREIEEGPGHGERARGRGRRRGRRGEEIGGARDREGDLAGRNRSRRELCARRRASLRNRRGGRA